MAGMDREFKELLISVTVVIIGFWAIVQLTSGLVWDWNGWKALEPQSYPPCEVNNFIQFTCSTAWIGMIETIKIDNKIKLLDEIINFNLLDFQENKTVQ